MTYETFFRTLTGNLPYKFQQDLAVRLLTGRSLILRAPTGAGKTWAAVAPFLYSLLRERPIADRLLYALPLRSLASSLHENVLAGMGAASALFPEVISAGKDRRYGDGRRYCSLQMGGETHDPFFESELVFTTIDQLLSWYLGLPVSLPKRVGNMVAGALIGSLIVLDEVHLLESDRAMGTTIEMLDRLQGLAQFVLMTATLSDRGQDWLASKLNADRFVISESEIRELPSQKTKRREWRWMSKSLTSDHVREIHHGGRTIALANTVGRAQELSRSLRKLYEGTTTSVLALHSRYFSGDRKAIEARLADYFGPDAVLTDVVLVTTQVIEAGLDISADDLLTELAPMNALIQRSGRVARYAHRNVGRVTVFDIEDPRPYDDSSIQKTREVVQRLPAEGRVVDFADEQLWIDCVHAGNEIRALAVYENLHTRRQQVHEAMEGDGGKLSDLVRDIDSVNVILTDRPEDISFSGCTPDGRRIGWPRMLSVPRTSLMRLAPLVEEHSGSVWVVKGARDAGQETPWLNIQWEKLESPGLLRGQWMVAIHPEFASYDAAIGLVLGVGGRAPEVQYVERPSVPRYQYDFEPWVDHARRVRDAARAMREAHRRGGSCQRL